MRAPRSYWLHKASLLFFHYVTGKRFKLPLPDAIFMQRLTLDDLIQQLFKLVIDHVFATSENVRNELVQFFDLPLGSISIYALKTPVSRQ